MSIRFDGACVLWEKRGNKSDTSGSDNLQW